MEAVNHTLNDGRDPISTITIGISILVTASFVRVALTVAACGDDSTGEDTDAGQPDGAQVDATPPDAETQPPFDEAHYYVATDGDDADSKIGADVDFDLRDNDIDRTTPSIGRPLVQGDVTAEWFEGQGVTVNRVDITPFREATMKLHNGPDATWSQEVYDRLQAIK